MKKTITMKYALLCMLIAFQYHKVQAQENTFSACHDGIDNDGDGLIDAVDPNCLLSGNTAVMGCITDAILVQTDSAFWYNIDLVSGQAYKSDDTIHHSINASGFNIKDYRIWSYNAGVSDGSLIVSTQDQNTAEWQSTVTPPISGLPTGQGFFVGDVDTNGLLYLTLGNPGTKNYYVVNVNPFSPDYLTLVDSASITIPSLFADWAFSPTTGHLYALERYGHLYRIDLSSGTLHDLGHSGIPYDRHQPYGATYFDKDGFFYASNNTYGDIYRIDVRNEPTVPFDSSTTVLFTSGPSSSGNDGARCTRAGLFLDLGDAPLTYATLLDSNGARHLIIDFDESNVTSNLYFGASVDDDIDGFFHPTADSSADDDGITAIDVIGTNGSPTVIPTYTLTATFNNISGEDAHFGAWLDWNGDGKFEDSEGVVLTVPGTTTTGTVDFTWNNMTFVPNGSNSFARIRISTDSMFTSDYKGAKRAGEVEDYAIPFNTNLALSDFYLRAKPEDNIVQLDWTTTEEYDMDHYDAQVSYLSTSDFRDIATVDARNGRAQTYTTEYTMRDKGEHFFRIQGVDIYGEETYSNIKLINNDKAIVSVYPQVVHDQLTVEVYTEDAATISVLGLDGKVLQNVKSKGVENQINMSGYSTGMYIVRVMSDELEGPRYFRVFVD